MKEIIVNGASGKMGQETVKAITLAPDMECVGKAGRDNPLREMLKQRRADVVVDMTHPEVARENAGIILDAGCHAVIGTTGFTPQDLEDLDALAKAKNRAIFICPNFAIGAILMMKAAQEAAKYFERVEIIESHHPKKADAPSGTAIKTAELIALSNPSINTPKLDEKELVSGSRGGLVKNIPIHSLRLPGVVANQDVVFGGLDQTYTLTHHTLSRAAFMPGVLLAIRHTEKHVGLVYGLENLI